MVAKRFRYNMVDRVEKVPVEKVIFHSIGNVELLKLVSKLLASRYVSKE